MKQMPASRVPMTLPLTVKMKVAVTLIFITALLIISLDAHSQWITGPIVNAILLLTTVIAGPAAAMVIGSFPGILALSRGLLPLPLAPLVPCIILANALYILSFYYIRSWGLIIAVIAASLVKSIFLYIMTFYFMPMINITLNKGLSIMMSWPQLITALAGGFIACGIIYFLRTGIKE
jgi:riboflavin transporter